MIRLTLLLTLAAVPAQAFTASNDLRVQPTGNTAFTVPYGGNSAPSAFWCAAGDYVVQALGQPPGTRIYRTSPPPRRAGQGMDFALAAAASPGKTGLALLGSDDGSITAALAQALCTSTDRN